MGIHTMVVVRRSISAWLDVVGWTFCCIISGFLIYVSVQQKEKKKIEKNNHKLVLN